MNTHFFRLVRLLIAFFLGAFFFLWTFNRQDNTLTSAVLLNYGDEGVLPYYGYSEEILKTQVYVQKCVFQDNDLLSELLEATVSQVLPTVWFFLQMRRFSSFDFNVCVTGF